MSFSKNTSNKYTQKLLNSAKKSKTDAINAASKREIQKAAEATGDLIGNKIADKISNVSKSSQNDKADNEISKRRKTTNY